MSIKKLHLDRETLVRLTEDAAHDIHGGAIVATLNAVCRPSVIIACYTVQVVCHITQNTSCCPITPACPTRPTSIPTSEPTTIETSY